MGGAFGSSLVVGVSSRALFDLDEANAVYASEGLEAYRTHQRDREDVPLAPGTGFALARALLALNERAGERVVEVLVLSRNDADTGVRVMNSAAHHGLDLPRYAFTAGRPAWPYLASFDAHLFLSADAGDVADAAAAGFPAARLLQVPTDPHAGVEDEVRVAFDGDAVLFDAASEAIYQRDGLDAFIANEERHASDALQPGPLKPFLDALLAVNARFPVEAPPIRLSLVTARNAAAHRRVITTLRSWGVRLHETFFLGGASKARVLAQLQPHIFFDDQTRHLVPASTTTPAGHVPGSPAGPGAPIEPPG